MGKLRTFFQTIKYFGGVRGFLLQLVRRDEAKMGHYVGEDSFGNQYFQNTYHFIGRSRWVHYNYARYGYDYDGSQVTPEWFGWLHYKTDCLPCMDPSRPPTYKWMLPPTENYSGTPCQYVPYSTTRPKIIPWKPPKKHKTC